MTTTIRAAYMPDHNIIKVGDFPMPRATDEGDLVVRMIRASICGSDVHCVFHGFLTEVSTGQPGYPGHEGIGEVVESRSSKYSVGDLVLTVPIGPIGGAFTEYQLIPDRLAVAIPKDGDIPRLLMAQQYGTTLRSMRLFWPELGNTGGSKACAIIGSGSAGLFFLQQAKKLGFEHIIISDLNEQRLQIATSLGADTVVHAPGESIIDAVMEVTDGVGADLVIEAAGWDSCRADAIECVKTLGTVGYFGFPQSWGMAEFPQFRAFRKIARIQWAGGTQHEPGLVAFHDAVRHIHEGEIDVDYCLGPVYQLEQIAEAMEVARDEGHGAIKLAIEFPNA